jgi:hypothetical protein
LRHTNSNKNELALIPIAPFTLTPPSAYDTPVEG